MKTSGFFAMATAMMAIFMVEAQFGGGGGGFGGSPIPSCAEGCVASAFASGSTASCGGSSSSPNVSCICNNIQFTSSASCCISKSCNSTDQAQLLGFVSHACGSQGAAVPAGFNCSGATGSATSTGARSTASNTAAGQNSGNTSSPTPAPGSSGGLSAGAKAGIAVGVILGVALLAILAIFLLRRRRQQKTRNANELEASHDPARSTTVDGSSPLSQHPYSPTNTSSTAYSPALMVHEIGGEKKEVYEAGGPPMHEMPGEKHGFIDAAGIAASNDQRQKARDEKGDIKWVEMNNPGAAEISNEGERREMNGQSEPVELPSHYDRAEGPVNTPTTSMATPVTGVATPSTTAAEVSPREPHGRRESDVSAVSPETAHISPATDDQEGSEQGAGSRLAILQGRLERVRQRKNVLSELREMEALEEELKQEVMKEMRKESGPG